MEGSDAAGQSADAAHVAAPGGLAVHREEPRLSILGLNLLVKTEKEQQVTLCHTTT